MGSLKLKQKNLKLITNSINQQAQIVKQINEINNKGYKIQKERKSKKIIFPIFCLSVYLLCCLSVYLFCCLLSVCLSVFLSPCLYFSLSSYLFVSLCPCLSVFLSFCLFVSLSFYLSVFLSFSLSVFLSFCDSVWEGLLSSPFPIPTKQCIFGSSFKYFSVRRNSPF